MELKALSGLWDNNQGITQKGYSTHYDQEKTVSVLFTSVDYFLTTFIDRFLSRIQKLVGLEVDRSAKPLDKVIFWIECTVRYKGTRHRRNSVIATTSITAKTGLKKTAGLLFSLLTAKVPYM